MSANATPSLKKTFPLDPNIFGPKSAASLEMGATTAPDVIVAVAGNLPFPARPNGVIDLSDIYLNASGGLPVAFQGDGVTLGFSFSAGVTAGAAVYDRAEDALASLVPGGAPELEFSALDKPRSRYVLLQSGYRASGSVTGSHPIGVLGSFTFGAQVAASGISAVLHRFPISAGADTALKETVQSWKLPCQVDSAAKLSPATWIVTEANGSLAVQLAASLGYKFNFVRQAKGLGLSGDIGLKIDAAAMATFGLKRHGTAKSVPALAALLTDEQLSHSARYALESMPGPEAEHAFIAALGQTNGLLKTGIINSLGVRRDPAAVPELAKFLSDSNAQIVSASAAALGEIVTGGALAALENQLINSATSAPDAVADGCLRCAQHLLTAGTPQAAYSVFQEIYQRQTKEFVHIAAFRGMVLAWPEHGVDLIANAIANGPAPIQMAAIQLVHEKELPGATEAVAKLLPKVNSLTKVALIGALSQRDDPAAVSEIAALAKNADAEVRVAALGALVNLGDDKDVPMLVEIAAASGDGQAAARQALTLIHRGTPNQALLKLLADAKAEAQVEIVRALNSRGATEAVPQLLQLAKRAAEPVQAAVFSALARLVDQSQLNALVQTVGEMPTDTGRAAAGGAVGSAFRRIPNSCETVDLSAVLDALKNGFTETRVALLPVCSSVADPKVRTALRACVADSNVNVHAAAVRALCHTMDAELVPDVVKTAGQTSDEEFRRLAIESFVRLATQEESITIPNPERVKFFQAIMPVAASTAEKRLALSGLAVVPDNGALKLAQPLLSDGTVSNEAALAVIGICRKLPDAEAAKAALENLISRGTGDPITASAA